MAFSCHTGLASPEIESGHECQDEILVILGLDRMGRWTFTRGTLVAEATIKSRSRRGVAEAIAGFQGLISLWATGIFY